MNCELQGKLKLRKKYKMSQMSRVLLQATHLRNFDCCYNIARVSKMPKNLDLQPFLNLGYTT